MRRSASFALASAFAFACAWGCQILAGLGNDLSAPGTAEAGGGADGADVGTSPPVSGDAGDAGAFATCDASGLGGDPKNCGACAHDCLGGACEAGRCKAIAFATTVQKMSDLANDGETIFWAAGAVYRKPEMPAEAPIQELGKTPGVDTHVIEVDGAFVYFIDNNLTGLFRLPKDAPAAPIKIARSDVHAVAFDADHIYLGTRDAPEIFSVLKDGGSDTKLVTGADVGGNVLYMGGLDGNDILYRGGSDLYRVSKQGGKPTKLAPSVADGHTRLTGIGGGEAVCRSDGPNGRVLRTGGPKEIVYVDNVVPDTYPEGFAVDEAFVYVLVRGDAKPSAAKGALLRFPKGGGPPETLASGLVAEDANQIGAMVTVTKRAVYFATSLPDDRTQLLRIAK